jgi:VanZ family protein
MLVALVVLTVVPPNIRPVTPLPHSIEHAAFPHGIEHAATFLLAGILFGTAYLGRERMLSVGAVVFCAAIEAVQLYVPGRHARISDFVIDTAAGIAGVFLGSFMRRMAASLAKLPKRG